MIGTVIFDMDGVIVDTEPISCRCHNKMVKDLTGKDYTWEFHETTMGLSVLEVMKIIKKDFLIDLDEDILIKRRNEIFEKLLLKELKVLNGFFQLLDYIKENNLKCAVATGNSRKITETIFNELDILYCFDSIICSDETMKCKPDPWIYNQTMKKLKVNKDECLVLEDSQNGVLAALNSGSKVIVVNSTWEFEENENIISKEKDLTMIPKIINNLNNKKRGKTNVNIT